LHSPSLPLAATKARRPADTTAIPPDRLPPVCLLESSKPPVVADLLDRLDHRDGVNVALNNVAIKPAVGGEGALDVDAIADTDLAKLGFLDRFGREE